MNLDNEDGEVPDLVQRRSTPVIKHTNETKQELSMNEAADIKVPITIITGT